MANTELSSRDIQELAQLASTSQDFMYRAGRASAALEIAAAVRDFDNKHSEHGMDWLAVYWDLLDLIRNLAEKIEYAAEGASKGAQE